MEPHTDTLLLLFLVCLTAGLNLNAEVAARINLSKLPPVATTSPSFLSVALDSGVIANGFWPLNFSHPRLVALARGLGPAYLRYLCSWVGHPSSSSWVLTHCSGQEIAGH